MLVTSEPWPTSVCVLKTQECFGSPLDFAARPPAQCQYGKTYGFDRVLISPISPSSGGSLMRGQLLTKLQNHPCSVHALRPLPCWFPVSIRTSSMRSKASEQELSRK